MQSFNGKVAAITGAGSGIGRSLALELAGQGCELALSDIGEKGLAETVALAQAKGVKVTSAKLDVADRDAIYAWAAKVVADHGRVNLIFNNAGVALGATVEGASDEDLKWIMDINFWGVVHGTRAFMPHLRASGDGHVINISSLFGLVSIPTQSAYNASKFAVRGFTESLRMELEMGNAPVSCTCVHPGGIKTNIARAARMSDSLKTVGAADPEASRQKFEKLLATTTPDKAAQIILKAVKGNQRRVLVGPDAVALEILQRIVPAGYQRLVMRGAKKGM